MICGHLSCVAAVFIKTDFNSLCYHPCEHGLRWKGFRAGYEALILTMTMSTLPSAGQISFPACEETLRQRGIIMLYVAGCEIFWQRKHGLILNSSRWKIQSGVMWTQSGEAACGWTFGLWHQWFGLDSCSQLCDFPHASVSLQIKWEHWKKFAFKWSWMNSHISLWSYKRQSTGWT